MGEAKQMGRRSDRRSVTSAPPGAPYCCFGYKSTAVTFGQMLICCESNGQVRSASQTQGTH
eukprot:917290-Pelagomonas_calceolata.AAC.5